MNKVLIGNMNTTYLDPNIFFPVGAKQTVELKFEFQKKWESELTLIALFKRKDDKEYAVKLDDYNCCKVPKQILKDKGEVNVRLIGVNYNYGNVYLFGGDMKENAAKITYRNLVEYSLELEYDSKIFAACKKDAKLVKISVDDEAVSFSLEVDSLNHKEYNVYSTDILYAKGTHRILAEFNVSNITFLDDNKVIEEIEKNNDFEIVKSTSGCDVPIK